MTRRALITGITGQDGSYLAEFLLEKGYEVFGLVRRSSHNPFRRLAHLEPNRRINILYGNLRDNGSLYRALEVAKPDEIYNLAAQSDVGISFMIPEETMEINYHGLGRVVHAAMDIVPHARIYQASTSEMFGATPPPQSELSPFMPVSPYGIAKLRAHEDFVVGYRERHGVWIASGILFNHESPRRGEHFVTRKITISLAKIKLGLQDCVELGNLEAQRDWGFAGDYVRAMWQIIQYKDPEDFVIATGESHSVREFVNAAAAALDMSIKWEGKDLDEVGVDSSGNVIVRINKDYYRPSEVHALRGDATKAKERLGWKPTVSFEQLVEMMARADFEAGKKGIFTA